MTSPEGTDKGSDSKKPCSCISSLSCKLFIAGFWITGGFSCGLGVILVIFAYMVLRSVLHAVFFKLPILAECHKNGVKVNAVEQKRWKTQHDYYDDEESKYKRKITWHVRLRTCRNPCDSTRSELSALVWERDFDFPEDGPPFGPEKVHRFSIIPDDPSQKCRHMLEPGYDFGVETERCRPCTWSYAVELAKVALMFLVVSLLLTAYFSVVVFILCKGAVIAWILAMAILGPLLLLPWLREMYYDEQAKYLRKFSWRRISIAHAPGNCCDEKDCTNEVGISLDTHLELMTHDSSLSSIE